MKGFPNFGNTCYINSIIQILLNTPPFLLSLQSYCDDGAITPDMPAERKASLAFIDLAKVYHDPAVPREHFHDALRKFIIIFRTCHEQFGFGQHDPHEYLMYFLKIIHDNQHTVAHYSLTGEGKTAGDRLEQKALENFREGGMSTTEDNLRDTEHKCYDSPISRLFTGQYRFQTECQNPSCKYISNRFDTFRSWEVSIGAGEAGKSVNLLDSLQEFTGITQLSPEDMYECDKCKQKTQSLRKCTLWRVPPILIIFVKRNIYKVDRGRPISYKDNREIDVPEILDVAPYLSAPRSNVQYQLYGTANHMGTPHGGHCYSHIKGNDGSWNIVDDMSVKLSGRTRPEHKYILFYHAIYKPV